MLESVDLIGWSQLIWLAGVKGGAKHENVLELQLELLHSSSSSEGCELYKDDVMMRTDFAHHAGRFHAMSCR